MPTLASPQRRAFFRERFPDFWADAGGEPYALFDAFLMENDDVDVIRTTAAEAWRIMCRIAPVMRALPDAELVSMGIPTAALRVCRRTDETAGESTIARFDFALTPSGPKILELNAETPMFVWESFEISGAVARALGHGDPNDGAAASLRAAIVRAVGTQPSRVAVSAHNVWREDWFSAVYLARVAGEALGHAVDAIPLHELRVRDGMLSDAAGTRVDVLLRLYPLEHFAADRDGPRLFDLVERGALRLINPSSALLLQNKATLGIIWALAQRGVWFDANERATIARCFLPTHLEPPTDDQTYVRKPVLGREGNSIAIVRGNETLAASTARNYLAQPAVYQQFVPLRATHGGRAIATCFVVGGEPSAVALRVGTAITDSHARFLPIGIPR
jgi:glutathionylspermidine synthase